MRKSEDLAESFGEISHTDGVSTIIGKRPYARGSVMFDVINRIAIDSRLEKAKAYEVDIASQHLEKATSRDLIIFDRGYASFRMVAELTSRKINFLIRCSKAGFKIAQEMFEGLGKDSQIADIEPPKAKRKEIRLKGLPTEVRVRFVRVQLDTGENEILVTNLLSETDFPTKDFKELYWKRWGVETFYGVGKTRLCLENFTGFSAESVRQDFYSTIFLTGLETILTEDAEDILSQIESSVPDERRIAEAYLTFTDVARK